jgi:AcrR family transcriptional regulator
MEREQILEAAAQIISRKGFHAASMQDIAEAVNLQKASLYHHVSSKQEILFDLLDQTLDLLTERVSAAFSQGPSIEDRLRQGMRAYLSTLAENADLAVVLLLEHRSLDPQHRERHISRRDRFERLWRELLQEGISAGVFREIDPGLAGRALLGIMNWTITWYRPDGPLPIETISDQFAALFLDGLRAL